MEGRLNKKLLLISIKYSTWVIGIIYLIQIILGAFGVQSILLTYLFGASIFPLMVLIMFSVFLGFCIWHRLPLYYALTANGINLIDYYIGIPIVNKWMLIIYLLLVGIFMMIGCFIKNRNNARKGNITKGST